MLEMDGDRRRLGEQMTPCGKRRGRRGICGMMGRRQGNPGWADDPVRVQNGHPDME